MGWSDPSPAPRDAQHIATELHKLLQNAQVPGPYVLVGWSYGGLYVPVPRFQKVDVEPFTQEEIECMLKACTYSRDAETFMHRKFAMRRPTANRDQAIILTLLDSGIRASEFSSLRVGDFEVKKGKLEIRHGVEGGATGGKGRIVYLGKTARHALWRYLAEREDGEDPNAPLFTVRRSRAFNPGTLRHSIKNIAARAGVKSAYPHKFRHTFAITYLRSGGDVFTLQSLLGHGGLDVVRHYTRIAQMAVEQAHRKASPVDNWRLFRFLEGPYADPFHNGLYSDVISLNNEALVDIDKMSTEEIYYWRGMAKANLEDWDGAAQDLRRAHLLNPNFLPPGKELKRIHSLGLASSVDNSPNPILTDLVSSQRSYFITIAGLSISGIQSDATENAK